MNITNKRLLAVTTAVLCATPALAQDVAPPAAMTAEAIGAWVQAAKIADKAGNIQWNLETADANGVVLIALEPKGADGMAKVGVRRERFQPAAGVRSESKMYDVDCGKNLIKATTDQTFQQHNLSGSKTDRTTAADWAPATSDPVVASLLKDACTAAPAPAATVAANVPKNEKELKDWIRKNKIRDTNVDRADWSLLSFTNVGPLYATIDKKDDSTRTATMRLRLERFNPEPNQNIATSEALTQTYEINCRSNQARKTAEIAYAEHNLLGKQDANGTIENWSPVEQNPLLKVFGAEMCKNFDVKRDFMVNAK